MCLCYLYGATTVFPTWLERLFLTLCLVSCACDSCTCAPAAHLPHQRSLKRLWRRESGARVFLLLQQDIGQLSTGISILSDSCDFLCFFFSGSWPLFFLCFFHHHFMGYNKIPSTGSSASTCFWVLTHSTSFSKPQHYPF